MILGVVLAGGESRRFGSDKALAQLDGTTLLTRAVDRLSGWCERVVVAGRAQAPAPTVPDWPRAGMGPLGGLAAALRLAADQGHAAVLSCGVDSLDLPDDLLAILDPAPACLRAQPVVGLWPVGAAPIVERILTGEGRHSMRRLVEETGARMVETPHPPANINTPADLQALRAALEARR